jgi:hypothetical protein
MLRDAFAIDAAAVKHRFCNSFRGLSPMEFSTFSFRSLGSIPPVRLRETGKNWELRRLTTEWTFDSRVPARQRGRQLSDWNLNRGLRARLLALIRGQNWP